MRYFILMFTFVCSFVAAQPTIVPQLQQQVTDLTSSLNSQEKKELTHKLESIFNNTQVQIALAREEESKKGMDSAQVTGATSSYARKYCLNGLFGIDDAKDADTDEHKHQQNAAAKQSKPSPTPEQVLKAFTDAAMQKNTVEELKQAFAKAWKMLEGTPEQHKAQDVYNIRRDELEGAAA